MKVDLVHVLTVYYEVNKLLNSNTKLNADTIKMLEEKRDKFHEYICKELKTDRQRTLPYCHNMHKYFDNEFGLDEFIEDMMKLK